MSSDGKHSICPVEVLNFFSYEKEQEICIKMMNYVVRMIVDSNLDRRRDTVLFSEVNGISLHYLDRGQGEALLLVHGLGEDCTSWDVQISEFSADYRVICPDLRGHGRSGENEEKLSLRLLSDDLAQLLTGLGIEKVHFCGLSLGGLIAFEFYRLYPSRVISLILANTFATIPEPYRSQNLEQNLEMLEELSMEEYGKVFALNCLSKQVSPEVYSQVAKMFGSNKKEPYKQGLAAVYTADFTELLPSIKVPALIITGEFDRNSPLSFAELMAEKIENSRLIMVKNSGHLTNLENTQEFNRGVGSFLKSLK